MKRFLIIAICLFGLGLQFASSVSNPSSSGSAIFAPPSNDGWESIGAVDLHSLYSDGTAFDSGTASLYAKAIGNKIVYQIRYTLKKDNSSHTYTVATGYWEFYCKTHKIWHSFDGKAGDSYLNLP